MSQVKGAVRGAFPVRRMQQAGAWMPCRRGDRPVGPRRDSGGMVATCLRPTADRDVVNVAAPSHVMQRCISVACRSSFSGSGAYGSGPVQPSRSEPASSRRSDDDTNTNTNTHMEMGMDLESAPQPVNKSSNAPSTSGLWQKVTGFFKANAVTKEKLASLGFGAFCAYGVISNVNAGILITIAWLSIVKSTGTTPLAEGNMPKFLAVYGGLWVSSHFMRPIRLSLAIAAAPFFDTVIERIMQLTRTKNKFVAFAIMLLGIAIFTISTLAGAIFVCGGFV